MIIQLLNRLLEKITLTSAIAAGWLFLSVLNPVYAQYSDNDRAQNQDGESKVTQSDIDNIRWKTESQVRELLGEPNSVHGPVGTHATYTLWKYSDYTVAFANQRAFHLFDKNSLTKFELNENR